MNARSVVSLGEVLWDLFPEGPRFGGAPANFACHAALLGGKVTLVSAVGEDDRGRSALSILGRFGIDTSLIQHTADAGTGAVNVSVNAAGKPTFEILGNAAWDRIVWTPALAACVAEADTVYFGTLGQRGSVSRSTIRQALDVARKAGIRRVLDVNLRPPFFDDALIRDSVAQASVVKLSDDELAEVVRACGIAAAPEPAGALRALLARFELELVAMTRGASGALLVSANEIVDQPGIPVVVRDTVGAGDSFTAALVMGLLKGEALRTIARSACEISAAVCTQVGAVPERPR